jgi:hypothetical protein
MGGREVVLAAVVMVSSTTLVETELLLLVSVERDEDEDVWVADVINGVSDVDDGVYRTADDSGA